LNNSEREVATALTEVRFFNSRVINDLPDFKLMADFSVANRETSDMQDFQAKFTVLIFLVPTPKNNFCCGNTHLQAATAY